MAFSTAPFFNAGHFAVSATWKRPGHADKSGSVIFNQDHEDIGGMRGKVHAMLYRVELFPDMDTGDTILSGGSEYTVREVSHFDDGLVARALLYLVD